MVLAAPEFIEAEFVDLLDEIEVAAELQHRMLADRVMRGEEGSEFEARHEARPHTPRRRGIDVGAVITRALTAAGLMK